MKPRRLLALGAATAATLVLSGGVASAQTPTPPATPKADCGPGSRPETGLQGQVSPEDHTSGRAAKGFWSPRWPGT